MLAASSASDLGLFCTFVRFEKSVLESARPTAVNLANALNRMVDGLENLASVAQAKELLRARATPCTPRIARSLKRSAATAPISWMTARAS